jgi:hypothetical protein
MAFWTIIPELMIHGKPAPYGVINERAIRATAGTMMLIWFITFVIIYTTKDYSYLYPVVIAFWLQFFISVLRWPTRAPFSMLGRWMVRKQQPDYVGAIQKRFARWLGLAMATAMLIVTAWFGIKGYAPFAICMTCLFFMRMESALGICVGCKIYYALIKLGWIQDPEHKPACPGGACTLPTSS